MACAWRSTCPPGASGASRFADDVIQILGELGVPARRLIIEVTETALLADPARAAAVLTRLADAGVGISLDDFGQGQTHSGTSPLSRSTSSRSTAASSPTCSTTWRTPPSCDRSSTSATTFRCVSSAKASRPTAPWPGSTTPAAMSRRAFFWPARWRSPISPRGFRAAAQHAQWCSSSGALIRMP